MKIKYLIVLLISTIIFMSCENEIKVSENRGKVSGAFDPKPYMDVTLKNLNGKDVSVNEFNSLCNGTYRNYNNSDMITINKTKGTVKVSIKNCELDEYKGKIVTFEYKYKLMAAGKNLVYLLPENRKEIELFVDNQLISTAMIKDMLFFIPMYGFGEGRIEVSAHLKNESFVSNGTYWSK